MPDKLVTTMSGRTFYEVGRDTIEVLAATKTLNVDDCGKIFFLTAAAGFTTTLPTIADAGVGWTCRFIVKTAATSNGYIITEDATTETNAIITNGIVELETDTNDDGPNDTGHTTITFAANTAIPGDHIEILCDGTNYYCNGQVKADGGIALA